MSSHQSEQIGLMSPYRSEGSGTNASNDDHSSGTSNRRSKVWEHFETDLVEVDGAIKAVCRYCGMKMATRKSGTNSLRNHIKDSCRKISEDDRQRFIATIQKQPFVGPFTFNSQRSRALMITWSIQAEVAFNKFEDPSFSPWMASL
jgi:hypothetical protein